MSWLKQKLLNAWSWLKAKSRWFLVGTTVLVAGTGGVVAVDETIDPYTDKGSYYELSIVSDTKQGTKQDTKEQRVEIKKDKAQMDLVFWNDEQRISIIPQIPDAPTTTPEIGVPKEKKDKPFTGQANRQLFSKKMEFAKGTNTSSEITAFIEPKAGTENEFDIDFTLYSKPVTNVFTYNIEGADHFDFFYQPALTAEEIANGAFRPENVVGSYAVYHKFKANNLIGTTNYGTGKAFHIYRPKAIDAKGNEVWAQLNYQDGVLSVTVPPRFLDNATYPVVVDPTFGYTNAGASNSITSTDTAFLQIAPALESGVVTSVSVYASNDVSGNEVWKGGIFSSPTLFMGESDSTGIITTLDWYSVDFTSGLTVNGLLDYYVGVYQGYSASGNARIYYDLGKSGNSKTSTGTWATWPSTFTNVARNYSIYATYTIPSRTITTANYNYCRLWTMNAGGTSGGVATTTTLGYQLVATTTLADLAATSSSGQIQLLQAVNATNTIPVDITFANESTCYENTSTDAIPHYVETWASTTGAIVFHVNHPDISSTTAKKMTMYYGNTSASNLHSKSQTYATSSVLSPEAVWDLSQYPVSEEWQLDSTYNTNHGRDYNIYSATSSVSSQVGNGVVFDGGNDWIDAGTGGANLTGEVTVSAWVNTRAGNTLHDIIAARGSTGAGAASTQQFQLSYDADERPRFQVSNGTSLLKSVTGAGGAPNEVWNHLVGTFNGTSTTSLFVNGVQVDTDTTVGYGSLNSASIGLGIGSRQIGGSAYINGTIDDVRIYSKALSSMDVLTLYNNTVDSDTFWDVGSAETPPSGAATPGSFPRVFINGIINIIGNMFVQ